MNSNVTSSLNIHILENIYNYKYLTSLDSLESLVDYICRHYKSNPLYYTRDQYLNLNSEDRSKFKFKQPALFHGEYSKDLSSISSRTKLKDMFLGSRVLVIDIDGDPHPFEYRVNQIKEKGYLCLLYKTVSYDAELKFYRYRYIFPLSKRLSVTDIQKLSAIMVRTLELSKQADDHISRFPYMLQGLPIIFSGENISDMLSLNSEGDFCDTDSKLIGLLEGSSCEDSDTTVKCGEVEPDTFSDGKLSLCQIIDRILDLFELDVPTPNLSNYVVWTTLLRSFYALFYDMPREVVEDRLISWSSKSSEYDGEKSNRIIASKGDEVYYRSNGGERFKWVAHLLKSHSFKPDRNKHVAKILTTYINNRCELHCLIYSVEHSSYLYLDTMTKMTLESIGIGLGNYKLGDIRDTLSKLISLFPNRRVHKMYYDPEDSRGYNLSADQEYYTYNLFKLPEYKDRSYDSSMGRKILVNHISMLLTSKPYEGQELEELEERVQFLVYYFANILQYPHRRKPIMPVVSSIHGTGKSELISLFNRLYGEDNVSVVSTKMLKEDYNGYLANNLVCVLDDVSITKSINEDIKKMISGGTHNIRKMQRDHYRCKNTSFLLGFINPEAKFNVEDQERRYYMMKSNVTPEFLAENLNSAYHYKVRSDFSSYAGDIFHFLESLHIPDSYWDITTAPKTELLQQYKSASKDKVFLEVESFIEENGWGEGNKTVFTYKQLAKAFRDCSYTRGEIHCNNLPHILKSLGFYYHPSNIKVKDGETIRPYAKPDFLKSKGLSLDGSDDSDLRMVLKCEYEKTCEGLVPSFSIGL